MRLISLLGQLTYFVAIGSLVCFIAARLPTAARAAVFETANFRIECYDAALARAVAEQAEACRTELWKYWLGTEPPDDWAYKCEVLVRVTNTEGGGNTSMAFEAGEVFGFEGTWSGKPERILDSVVPHEVTHTVLASHFRRPLPRAIDEGMCTAVEDDAARDLWRREVIDVLTRGRSIPLAQLLAMTEYPADFAALYAQGSSLVEFLLALGEPADLVRCAALAKTPQLWPAALRRVYGFEDLTHVQESWLAWLKSGRGHTTAGYERHAANQCQLMPNGQMICPNQSGGWQSAPSQQFQVVQPAPRQQRAPLVPRTFAGGAGVKVEGPRGGSVAVGATRTPAAPAAAAGTACKPCDCPEKFARVDERLAAIDAKLGEIAGGLEACATRDQLGGYVTREQLQDHSPDLSGFVTRDQIPAPPSIDHLATREELEAAAAAAEEKDKSIVERLAAVAKVAASATAQAAVRGGLLEGVGVGGLAAGVGGPIGLGLVIGAWVLKRRLKKRLASAGGRSKRVFRDRPKPLDGSKRTWNE